LRTILALAATKREADRASGRLYRRGLSRGG
jgi:hypothetical protein